MSDDEEIQLPSLQHLLSVEQAQLLDVIDSLRSANLGEIVSLPQLIVCGDQSSGKSSVLEAITGIPFPRQDYTCTRFATEIILRRDSHEEICASIRPSEDRKPAERDALEKFKHEIKSKADIVGVFGLASTAMGIVANSKSFAKDVLTIEMRGPTQLQLTLVDLPGFIHATENPQTDGDPKLIQELVHYYMQNPRSIILSVVAATYDFNLQVILQRARAVDKSGMRTLGILTKPDKLKRGSTNEKAFLSLVRNERVKFELGWHVVKNLESAVEERQSPTPPEDISPPDRDAEEIVFFENSSFGSLPADSIGIESLRTRLSKVLFNQIRTELPKLFDDIETQLTSTQAALDKLGPSRSEFKQQQKFLVSLSQSFQGICQSAVRGDYDHQFFKVDTTPERHLCSVIMNMHSEFAKKMRTEGCTWNDTLEESDEFDTVNKRSRTREEAIRKACKLLQRSRGRELPGLPNPLLVGELFREYSQAWASIARSHIKAVWTRTSTFIALAISHFTDVDAAEKILKFWLQPAMEKQLALANTKLQELLDVHDDHPLTYNYRFLQDRQHIHRENKLRDVANVWQKGDVWMDALKRVDQKTTKAVNDIDMLAAETALTNMYSFYEVALSLFIDNVPTLTIHSPLLRPLPSLFSPTTILDLDPSMIHTLASESPSKALERSSLLHRISILETGRRICRENAVRLPQGASTLTTPASDVSTAEGNGSQTQGKHSNPPKTPDQSFSETNSTPEPPRVVVSGSPPSTPEMGKSQARTNAHAHATKGNYSGATVVDGIKDGESENELNAENESEGEVKEEAKKEVKESEMSFRKSLGMFGSRSSPYSATSSPSRRRGGAGILG